MQFHYFCADCAVDFYETFGNEEYLTSGAGKIAYSKRGLEIPQWLSAKTVELWSRERDISDPWTCRICDRTFIAEWWHDGGDALGVPVLSGSRNNDDISLCRSCLEGPPDLHDFTIDDLVALVKELHGDGSIPPAYPVVGTSRDALDVDRSPGTGSPSLDAVSRLIDKVGRNDPCPCGSGMKYKFCHGRNR